ncbi:MAG: type II toxin-antitoxin system VapC family toxin [Rhodobiaceae bacterium]|nr:type II toxin-antitoxin system VapC family toxin [Rhodobiaceae bacterium]
MLRYLLDTNICIFLAKDRPPTLQQKVKSHDGRIAVSSVVLAELRYGADKSARPEKNHLVVDGLVARVEVLSFNQKAADHYGQIRADLERKGLPIGPYDLMIAAHAQAEGLVLVTNNVREFERVPGLRVEDWTQV